MTAGHGALVIAAVVSLLTSAAFLLARSIRRDSAFRLAVPAFSASGWLCFLGAHLIRHRTGWAVIDLIAAGWYSLECHRAFVAAHQRRENQATAPSPGGTP